MTQQRRESRERRERVSITSGEPSAYASPSRRQFLQLSGSALTAAAVFQAGTGTAKGAPDAEFVPAADGNYDPANRTPSDVRWIVVHTTNCEDCTSIDEQYQSAINHFQNPSSGVSAHYVVSNEPGELTQMVRNDDVAFTAGNRAYNDLSINVEMAGRKETDFSDQLYENVADLMEYLCEEYDIPKRHPTGRIAPCDPEDGEGGIIGHVQIPSPNDCSVRGGINGHTDPGPHFDYDRLLSMIRGDGDDGGGPEYKIGQDVVATEAVNVRTSAAVGDNVEHTQPAGTVGTITDGYVTADGFVWWRIYWENEVGGWSPQSKFEATNQKKGGDCGTVTKETKLTGRITANAQSGLHSYAPKTATPESIRLDLAGPSKTDFDLYVTTDGREPSRTDYDRRSYSKGSQETVGFGADAVSSETNLRMRVDGYAGTGDYVLKVTETGESCDDRDDDGNEAPDDATFDVGQRVVTTAELNVRQEPSTDNEPRDAVEDGVTGYVVDGIVTADGYTWWKVGFGEELNGWCVEQHLAAYEGDVLPFDTGTDLTRPVDVTADELDAAVEAAHPGSPLVGLGDVWIEMQRKWGINAVYQAAHAALESGWGESSIAQNKHNIYGYDARTSCPAECADGYDSFEHCVRVVMPIVHDDYLTPGGDFYNGPTLDGMNVMYADDKGKDTPPYDAPWWKDKIVDIYHVLAAELPDDQGTAAGDRIR